MPYMRHPLKSLWQRAWKFLEPLVHIDQHYFKFVQARGITCKEVVANPSAFANFEWGNH